MKTFKTILTLVLILVVNSFTQQLYASLDTCIFSGSTFGVAPADRLSELHSHKCSPITFLLHSPNMHNSACLSSLSSCPSYVNQFTSDISLYLEDGYDQFSALGSFSDFAIYVSDTVLPSETIELPASPGAISLLLFGLLNYLVFTRFYTLYVLITEFIGNVFSSRFYFEKAPLIRNVKINDIRGVFSGSVASRDIISGRNSVAVGFAGLLKMLAKGYVTLSGSRIILISIEVMARQVCKHSVCAILFALSFAHRSIVDWQLFWENNSCFRRCVSRYSASQLGRLRLATVTTGLGMLRESENKPGFNRSFAISLPAFLVARILHYCCFPGIISGQVNIYPSVYQSRLEPLLNLFSYRLLNVNSR